MKNIILIFLTILLFSGCKKHEKIIPQKTMYQKIDSVLFDIAKTYELPNKFYDRDSAGVLSCDSFHPQKAFPLLRKIYNPFLGVTFEFRVTYDRHNYIEIILCYDDNIIHPIMIMDNQYYIRCQEDTMSYEGKLTFEKDLKQALKNFGKKQNYFYNYSSLFVDLIMDNLSNFDCYQMSLTPESFSNIKHSIQIDMKRGFNKSNYCLQNELSNIEKLEKELKRSQGNGTLYYSPYHQCIYYFTFYDYKKENKFFDLKVINKECYNGFIL